MELHFSASGPDRSAVPACLGNEAARPKNNDCQRLHRTGAFLQTATWGAVPQRPRALGAALACGPSAAAPASLASCLLTMLLRVLVLTFVSTGAALAAGVLVGAGIARVTPAILSGVGRGTVLGRLTPIRPPYRSTATTASRDITGSFGAPTLSRRFTGVRPSVLRTRLIRRASPYRLLGFTRLRIVVPLVALWPLIGARVAPCLPSTPR